MPQPIGKSIVPMLGDDRGQATVEYTLLLAAFGLPLIALFAAMLRALGQFFEMVSLLETLPLP